MNKLEEAALALESNGLYTNWHMWKQTRVSERHVQSINITDIPPVIPFAFNEQKSNQISHLFYEDNLWHFVYWRWVPGPGPDDFSVELNHLSEAIETITNFYRGQSQAINGWVIPLYRHPELNVDTVSYAIKNNVIHLTQTQFEQVNETVFRAGEKLNKRGFPNVLPFRFLEIKHESDSNHRLYLRRDGEVAYVVES